VWFWGFFGFGFFYFGGGVLVNSKAKGNSGERDIARILSLVTGVAWKRVPCSGALFTSEGRKEFRGDVYTTHPDFCDLVVEVKNHRGVVSFNDWVRQGGLLQGWWEQLCEECCGGFGILFFKSQRSWCWRYKLCGINLDTGFVKALKGVSWWRLQYGVIDSGRVRMLEKKDWEAKESDC